MNTAVIITKTEPETKRQFQEVAEEFGLSLSSLLNAYIKQVIRTRKIEFTLDEKPNKYLIRTINQALTNRKQGRASPIFKDGQDSLKWLKQQGV